MIISKVQPVHADVSENESPVASGENLAEDMFALLLVDLGLKPSNSESTVRDMLDEVMGYDSKSVRNDLHIGAVQVDVQLAREKDVKMPHRVDLAQQVRDTVNEKLQDHVSPGGSLHLLVRVVLVSDGASVASRRFTSGVGNAKVTVSYCLVDRKDAKSGASSPVVLANTVYQTAECTGLDLDNYWESSSAVVRSLARQAAQHIIAQITLHLVQWTSHYEANRERIENIKVKLAQEEDLDADDFAFAAEKHLL